MSTQTVSTTKMSTRRGPSGAASMATTNKAGNGREPGTENARGNVTQITVGTPDQADGENGDHAQGGEGQHGPAVPPVFGQPHSGPGGGNGNGGHRDTGPAQGPGDFPQGHGDGGAHENEKGRLDREQRGDDQPAEHDS